MTLIVVAPCKGLGCAIKQNGIHIVCTGTLEMKVRALTQLNNSTNNKITFTKSHFKITSWNCKNAKV